MKVIYKWLPEDEDNIKRSFESKGSSSLKNALSKLRENKDSGNWLHADYLEELKTKWQSPEWQEKARKNRQNRQSKQGLNQHSGGSISAKEHVKRMVSYFFQIMISSLSFYLAFTQLIIVFNHFRGWNWIGSLTFMSCLYGCIDPKESKMSSSRKNKQRLV